METFWMVRAGEAGAYAEAFLEHGLVSLGMGGELIGPVPPTITKKELLEKLRKAYPHEKETSLQSNVNQLHRFASELKVGDQVVTYDPAHRRYVLGRIQGEFSFDSKPIPMQPYVRRVNWTQEAPRDGLSVTTRNSLGAIQSLFRLNEEAAAELMEHAVALGTQPIVSAPPPVAAKPDMTLADLRDSMITKAGEFTDDLIASLDPYEMQDLVAGILRAMGYKTRVSGKGGDLGVDIFASPDGLGLQEPRIFVEVKHRPNTAIGSNDVRAFMGGRKASDRCLYVSTGGFTKEARYEAERAQAPLTLIDLPSLRTLLLEHYEALDGETRRLVPLTKLYWPAASEG